MAGASIEFTHQDPLAFPLPGATPWSSGSNPNPAFESFVWVLKRTLFEAWPFQSPMQTPKLPGRCLFALAFISNRVVLFLILGPLDGSSSAGAGWPARLGISNGHCQFEVSQLKGTVRFPDTQKQQPVSPMANNKRGKHTQITLPPTNMEPDRGCLQDHFPLTRSPSSALLPFFLGGVPYKNRLQKQKVGTNLFYPLKTGGPS